MERSSGLEGPDGVTWTVGLRLAAEPWPALGVNASGALREAGAPPKPITVGVAAPKGTVQAGAVENANNEAAAEAEEGSAGASGADAETEGEGLLPNDTLEKFKP